MHKKSQIIVISNSKVVHGRFNPRGRVRSSRHSISDYIYRPDRSMPATGSARIDASDETRGRKSDWQRAKSHHHSTIPQDPCYSAHVNRVTDAWGLAGRPGRYAGQESPLACLRYRRKPGKRAHSLNPWFAFKFAWWEHDRLFNARDMHAQLDRVVRTAPAHSPT
jgi:hypothetical protein